MQTRRAVILCAGTARRGRRRLWAFGYETLALLTGLSEGNLRQMVARGKLDPSDLRAVAGLIARSAAHEPGAARPPP